MSNNEVENRNGACVMEVASVGSRAKMGTKEGGNQEESLGWNDRMEAEAYLRFVSLS